MYDNLQTKTRQSWISNYARAVHPTAPFTAHMPHRLLPESFKILFALAWHTELSRVCCMALLAIEWSLLQRTRQRRCSDGCSEHFNSRDNPRKLSLPLGDLHFHQIHGSLPPPESSSETDRFSRLRMGPKCYAVQCIVNGVETPKVPLPLGIASVTPPEEDRAMAIGNMHENW